ncbi:5'-3' exoribonuclease 3-like [Rhododendron vialii]|uniref:5'-3' exoribonuclease 3-like n=1 Tax=Rhododendron vialii TaxID=182163 RepID=UPI00265E4DA1|nr:5'-3' exoribonuclease 3-like [Rhododendron vialii]
MGIPSFYRWLIERYPLAVTDVIEDPPTVVDGVSVPLDCSRPNPNGLEFDNLYLDMNGIIHPCFHPEGLPAPETYDEVFDAVFKYIDRIFSIVRPRKLLYMAIDGVAPRAKMNQQRTRRFRAAKDAADEAAKIESERGVQESEGQDLERTTKLDSNVITPGTEFMSLLSSALQYYIHLRMNMDPGWRDIKVILSDANVPGEGEHKIMSYIRLQRNLPGFDANTTHCLYGLDADLIMLALATHEIHFSILREDVRKAYTKDRWSTDKRQKKKGENEQEEAVVKNIEEYITSLYYQFLHVWVLRDYLVHDLSIPDPTVMTDLERLIDDFVFMCIFVGNDFLPHIPSLEIFEGAIDLLMVVYKEEFAHMGGYLTNSFEVNLGRVEHFVKAVSSHENAILRKRSQVQREQKIRFGDSSSCPGVKKVQSSTNHVTDVGNPVIDQVKLGEEGWKERYYAEKFEANTNDDREKIRGHSVLKYIEGICWVMHYYYQGVCSWQWFYPYHYAPFASDFCGLDQLGIHFVLGKPFKPFDQLMGVLPAASAHALPFFYRKLMTDSSSPILDFYPEDFELDMNGKRFLWQAICKLPFIKESRLLLEIGKVEHTLTEEEKRRNSLGLDILCIHKSHPLSTKIFSFWERNKDNPKVSKGKVKRKINAEVSGGMNGYIYISDEPVCPSEINPPTDAMVMITDNKVISVFYKFPCFHPHIPKPPEGVNMPVKFVRKQDVLPPPVLWHDRRSVRGRIYSERPIPNSISGRRLEKLAHRLVCKYYLAKEPGSQGSMEVGSDIVVDAMACQPNLKVTVSRKEQDAGGEHFIVVERTNKKRKRGGDSQKSASIGVDDLASQSNVKAAVSGKELDAGTGNCIVVEQVKKKRKQDSVSRKNRNKRWRINQAKRQQALANGIAPLEPALI